MAEDQVTPDVSTQDYIDAINDAKSKGRAVSINYGDLPKGVVAAALHTAMSNGLPQEYQDAIGEAAAKGKTISIDFSQVKPQQAQSNPFLDAVSNSTKRLGNVIQKAGEAYVAPVTKTGEMLDKFGGLVAENVGKTFPNASPYWGATAGMVAANAPLMFLPGPGELAGTRIGTAKIPLERLPSVKAAFDAGIPLRRAQLTGGKAAAGLENMFEKSLTGSGPIEASDARQMSKLGVFQQELVRRFGTSEPPSIVNNMIKASVDETIGAGKSLAQDLYKQVPEMPVKTPGLTSISKNILEEQAKLPPVNQNTGLIQAASQYLDISKQGTKFAEQWGRSNSSTPLAESPLSLNTLRAMQSDISSKIASLTRSGETITSPAVRGWARLQSAISSDIENTINSSDALTQYLGSEVKDKLTKANALWKTTKELDSSKLVKNIRQAPAEDIPQIIFGSGKSQNILVARSVLSDEAWKLAKQQYFTNLVNNPDLSKLIQGVKPKLAPEFLQSIFNKQELDALRQKAAISDILGAAQKVSGAQGSSRMTGAVAQTSAIGAGLLHAGTSALSGNIPGVMGGLGTAAASYWGPKIGSRLYVKYGVSGLPVGGARASVTAAANRVSALTAIKTYLQNEQSNHR